MLRREFAARASGFSMRLKDANPDDEFDCIALVDQGLVFVECKTGRDDLYGEVAKFVRRDTELSATYSFFVFDRDYTFDKGQDDTPRLTVKQANDLGISSIFKVTVGSQRFFHITVERDFAGGVRGQRFFMACAAFGGFENRIRYMIRYTDMVQESIARPDLFKVSLVQFTVEGSE